MSEDPKNPDLPLNTSRLEETVKLFNRYQVRFIVIGGQAESLMGSPRVTYDVDLCYERTQDNFRRLVQAMKELNPSLTGAPEGLPFVFDERTLKMGSNFTFNTNLGRLDLLGHVEPLGDFNALAASAATVVLENETVTVIDLDDLIRVKQHINRAKDRDSLFQLLAIKKLREETGLN